MSLKCLVVYSRRFLQQEDYYKDYFILDPRYKDWTEDPTYLFEEGKIYENLFDYLKVIFFYYYLTLINLKQIYRVTWLI